jgi:hypothetical protein
MARHASASGTRAAIVGGLAASWVGVGVEFSVAAQRTAVNAPADAVPAIRRALKLLPRQPLQVGVVGEENVGADSRERFRKAEAFFSEGSAVVYLTRHSPVLRAANQGSSVHVHVLAAIIWHEMAHIEGADEPQAQKHEEALWTRFVRDDRVDRTTALRYLKALSERHRP